MSDQAVFWRGDYLANKILDLQDVVDELTWKDAAKDELLFKKDELIAKLAWEKAELERANEAKSRTIRVLSEALVLTADTVDVPSLADFMGLVDVREEVGS